MATTALQPNLFEDILDPDVVKGLNIIIGQLQSIGAKLGPGGVGTIPASTSSASTGAPGASGTPQVNVSLPIPVSALEMVQSSIAAGNLAHASPSTSRLPITVPAAGSYTFTNNPPSGYVWVLAAPLLIFSDSYDEAILASGIIDGQIVINDFAMVAQAKEDIAQYVPITRSLKFTIVNDTASEVLVTPEVQYAKVLESIYLKRIRIVVQDGDALLERYAAAASARLAQGGA